jgi:DNA-binding transcriptional regulator PaaX
MRKRQPIAKPTSKTAARTTATAQPAAPTAHPSFTGKLGQLAAAITTPTGATLEELMQATGWQAHTVRAAITRLRQRGLDCRLSIEQGRKAYRLDEADEPMAATVTGQ